MCANNINNMVGSPLMIASSAFINDQIREECLEIGFDHIIEIPLQQDFLIRLFDEIEQRKQHLVESDNNFSLNNSSKSSLKKQKSLRKRSSSVLDFREFVGEMEQIEEELSDMQISQNSCSKGNKQANEFQEGADIGDDSHSDNLGLPDINS